MGEIVQWHNGVISRLLRRMTDQRLLNCSEAFVRDQFGLSLEIEGDGDDEDEEDDDAEARNIQ